MKLSVQNLHLEYYDAVRKCSNKIISNLSFNLEPATCLAIVGRNGTGKTTLIRALLGLQKINSGRILLDDQNLNSINIIDRAKIIGYLAQEVTLPEQMSVNRFLELVFYKSRLSASLISAKIDQALNLWKISEFRYRQLGKLSGGEKRIVQFVAATLHEPKILVLDEPDTFLDELRTNALADFLVSTRKNLGTSIIVVSHNLSFLEKLKPKFLLFEHQNQRFFEECLDAELGPYLKSPQACF